jgi:hypothetical protein
MKNKLINEEKHILLNDFNLHYLMWKKYIEIDSTWCNNEFIDVVLQTWM